MTYICCKSETSKNTNKLVLMWDCILYSVFIVLYNQGKKNISVTSYLLEDETFYEDNHFQLRTLLLIWDLSYF